MTMQGNTNRGDVRSERGQAMVEFAMVAPILLLILLAIIQCGITFNHYLTLTDAVRVGTREAAVSRSLPNPAALAEARVRSAASGSLDDSQLGVTVTFRDLSGGSQVVQGGNVTVKATYPFEIKILGITFGDGTLTSETTERVE
jgi:Flp pilus assembly protein TadG